MNGRQLTIHLRGQGVVFVAKALLGLHVEPMTVLAWVKVPGVLARIEVVRIQVGYFDFMSEVFKRIGGRSDETVIERCGFRVCTNYIDIH